MNSIKIIWVLLLLSAAPFHFRCQDTNKVFTAEQEEAAEMWLANLYEVGVSLKGDSLFISDEAFDLMRNDKIRELMYPEEYKWEYVKGFIKLNELKRAFWYMINLYSTNEENKKLVVRSVITYNQTLDMPKALTASLYTYGYMDPKISKIVDGVPQVYAPHILETKLKVVKEMIYYLDKYEAKEE
jgi:hypothetical protein